MERCVWKLLCRAKSAQEIKNCKQKSTKIFKMNKKLVIFKIICYDAILTDGGGKIWKNKREQSERNMMLEINKGERFMLSHGHSLFL